MIDRTGALNERFVFVKVRNLVQNIEKLLNAANPAARGVPVYRLNRSDTVASKDTMGADSEAGASSGYLDVNCNNFPKNACIFRRECFA